MTKMLSNYPNFEDRIAFNFELGPFLWKTLGFD